MKKLIVLRRTSQGFFLILFIVILWSTTYPLTGIVHPAVLFAADPLIMAATALSERVLIPGLICAFPALLLALLLGRAFCGWICPLGTAIDIAGASRRMLSREDDARNKKLRLGKYLILLLVTITALFGRQIAWAVDPVVIAARFVSLNLIPSATYCLNTLFVVLIKNFGMGGAALDLYRTLKASVLGVSSYYFPTSGPVLVSCLAILVLSLIVKRFWCRAICPLGALFALLAHWSPLRRTVERCSRCRACKSACRTGAIRDDLSYEQSECVLCMDCLYDCPQNGTRFRWQGFLGRRVAREAPRESAPGAFSRKNFLLLLGSSIFLTGFRSKPAAAGRERSVIRPPAALDEEQFLNRCVRCGNCMKVCITNGLQPVILESGIEGVWTPQLVPEIGYCEYQCTLCGRTCPTGAIKPLTPEEKRVTVLGVAKIDRSLCIPWAENKECIVCEEHCPVYGKAIKLEQFTDNGISIARPHIDEYLCVGCGICQNKCPVRPVRAVRVSPL